MILLILSTLLLDFVIQAFAIYILAGVFFYVFFISIGMKRLDSSAQNTSVWFKIIIAPATITLWPILLYKLLKLKS